MLEVACAVAFSFEIAIKLSKWGFAKYFRGPAWRWNILDFSVTFILVLEVTATLLILAKVFGGGRAANLAGATGALVALRALRMIRIVRFMTLLHSPMLK